MEKLMTFYREIREELSKVNWPTREVTIGTTAVVLVLVFVLAVYFGVLDAGFSRLARLVVG